jgi:hypothetical protein
LEIIAQSIIKGCFQRESSLSFFSCVLKIAKIKWLILQRSNGGKMEMVQSSDDQGKLKKK